MIIIDMNQIAVANLMMNLKMNNSKTIDENMVRHMILNSIRMYRKEHRSEYGEVVLTWDSKHSWRRDYYPEYKAGRRKNREESNLDWDDISEYSPALLAAFIMPLTYSISNGIALAFIVYVLAKVVSGKMNELNPAVLIIAGASLLHFILG